MTNTTNEVLDSAKDKFDHVVVVGIKDGIIDVAPSIATYQFCQWLLDRAKFELLLSEKQQLVVESKVDEKVENKQESDT